MDDRNGEIKPYRELIVNNAEKIEPLMTQMEQLSILSNVLNYVQHSKFNSMNHSLSVRPVNRYKINQIQEEKLENWTLAQFHRIYKKNIWTYVREFNQM